MVTERKWCLIHKWVENLVRENPGKRSKRNVKINGTADVQTWGKSNGTEEIRRVHSDATMREQRVMNGHRKVTSSKWKQIL